MIGCDILEAINQMIFFNKIHWQFSLARIALNRPNKIFYERHINPEMSSPFPATFSQTIHITLSHRSYISHNVYLMDVYCIV